MRSLVVILLVAGVFLFISCAPPRSNPVLFEQEVRDWTPIGTPVDEAARIMRNRGFSVLHADAADGGEEYLSCTRYRVNGVAGIETEWRAVLSIKDGHVSSITTDTQASKR